MTQQPTKIIDVKIEKVELHQTENAWKPTALKDVPNGDVVSRSQDDLGLS